MKIFKLVVIINGNFLLICVYENNIFLDNEGFIYGFEIIK